MLESHGIIKTREYQGHEPFTLAGAPPTNTLLDFWRWMGSDLLDNTMRGILAEYIVASALGITNHRRVAWREYDLEFQGLKIEVKSASYLQPWFQKDYSKISFGIAPRLAWDPETNALKGPAKRQSDLYVFCVLETKDIEKLNPLDIDQWGFYVVPTKILNINYSTLKSLSATGLEKIEAKGITYSKLKDEIESISKELNLKN